VLHHERRAAALAECYRLQSALNSRGAVADAVSVSRDAQVAFVFVALLLSGGAEEAARVSCCVCLVGCAPVSCSSMR